MAARKTSERLPARKLPPIAHLGPSTPAKQLFGRVLSPSEAATRSIGFYSRGCLAGGIALPVNGPDWQVMRLSRNRNWGTPQLISFLERFSREVPHVSGWPGILVGDMSQPRGGPMLTGHASHQIGLDVDIWLKPMPPYTLSREQREEMMSTNVVRADRLDVDPRYWTSGHLASDQGCGGRSRKCSASSSMRRSRRRCAARRGPIAPGSIRCARSSATTIISMSGSSARRGSRPARAGSGAAGRWLRPRFARLLVLAWHPASAPAAWSGAAAPGADAGRSARRLPHGADSEVAGRLRFAHIHRINRFGWPMTHDKQNPLLEDWTGPFGLAALCGDQAGRFSAGLRAGFRRAQSRDCGHRR